MIFNNLIPLNLKVGDKVNELIHGTTHISSITKVLETGTYIIHTSLEKYTKRGFVYYTADHYWMRLSELKNIPYLKRLLCSELDRIIPI